MTFAVYTHIVIFLFISECPIQRCSLEWSETDITFHSDLVLQCLQMSKLSGEVYIYDASMFLT